MVSAYIKNYGNTLRNTFRVLSTLAAGSHVFRNSGNPPPKKGGGGVDFKHGKKLPTKRKLDLMVPRSYTKTRTKTKRRRMNSSIEHQVGKVKLPTLSIRGGLGKLKRVKNEFKYSITKNYIFSAGTGLQAVGEGLIVANLMQITPNIMQLITMNRISWSIQSTITHCLNIWIQSIR